MNMDTKQSTKNFWWLNGEEKNDKKLNVHLRADLHSEISSSLVEYLEHEEKIEALDDDVDIPSILEEINRLSATSPLGQYRQDIGQLSIDEILREAEKIYLESSKSFEQLSHHSKTSQNLSELSSDKPNNSTPTPKSLSPLPIDAIKLDTSDSDSESIKASDANNTQDNNNYSLDFDSERKSSERSNQQTHSDIVVDVHDVSTQSDRVDSQSSKSAIQEKMQSRQKQQDSPTIITHDDNMNLKHIHLAELEKKDTIIEMLITDNRGLKESLQAISKELGALKAQQVQSKSAELSGALEALKDTQEQNTALQVQLEDANKSNLELRASYDQLSNANNALERRLIDLDGTLSKYKADLRAIQSIRDKLKENEFNTAKLLDHERQQVKTLKQQIDKDAKCVMDLNRQIKEMERIIARKHPDSVSALIVASRTADDHGSRKLLEERIKTLEQDVLLRDAQNSQVFIDVQDKFNQMKHKYESHIEDLELHVNDLKSQLKRRGDTFDVYTQTVTFRDEKIPAKDTAHCGVQTVNVAIPNNEKQMKVTKAKNDPRDTMNLATAIRAHRSEILSKDKQIIKLQKESDELRKTNRRLQKEREGSLRNLTDKKNEESQSKASSVSTVEDDIDLIRAEREKLSAQLVRLEVDYQALKGKRLQDLNTLQEAHEREIATYLANITPLREQLEVQQASLSALQKQLIGAKEELAVVAVERDHLNNKTNSALVPLHQSSYEEGDNDKYDSEAQELRRRLNILQVKYEERENRLRAIVHGLAQKSIANGSCDQCAERQQQLIGYKAELDQIIATLRCLQ